LETAVVQHSSLLVREAERADRRAAEPIVNAAGWTVEQRRAWRDGAPAIVLFDPADATVYGVVIVSPRDTGVFDLMAWAVAPALDQCAAARRLVEAMTNRVRRAGGERFVVSVRDEAAGEVLEACGFQDVFRREDRSPGAGNVVTYHLEL